LGQDWNAYAETRLKEELNIPAEDLLSQRRAISPGDIFRLCRIVLLPESNITNPCTIFGEKFFRSGHVPYETTQRAIEAREQKFESPCYDLFGKSFLSDEEPYEFYLSLHSRLHGAAQIYPPAPNPHIAQAL